MMRPSPARAELTTLPKVDAQCTAPSLIPTVNGNTVRSFPTHGQPSAAKGSSRPRSHALTTPITYRTPRLTGCKEPTKPFERTCRLALRQRRRRRLHRPNGSWSLSLSRWVSLTWALSLSLSLSLGGSLPLLAPAAAAAPPCAPPAPPPPPPPSPAPAPCARSPPPALRLRLRLRRVCRGSATV
jgi:hypothetical protein